MEIAIIIISVVLGAGLVSIGIGLAAVGIGAIPVVAGIALVGVTIAAVSKVVTELITAFDHLVTTFSESNGSIKSGITEIGSGLAGAITGFVTTLAVQTPIIKTALLTILNAAIDIVVDGITTINSKIIGNSEHFSGLPIIFGHRVTQKTCTRSTESTSLRITLHLHL